MSTKMVGAVSAALLVAVLAGILLFGGDDEAQATETDGAFVTEMAPHHESAIAMAEVALERAEHPEIKQLAGEIIAAQEGEIEELDAIHQRLFGEPVGAMDHGSLGLSEAEMGMEMGAGEAAQLEGAEPFDRAFIDSMVPHHQGAIVMARIELAEGDDDVAKALAEQIIAAQTSEIEAMNEWRTKWYGAPSPAGGVPPASAGSVSHEGMEM